MSDLISMEAKAIEQDKRVTSFAWALIMETAASFEVASYSISDADAKKSAEGAIKYARDTANKYYTTPQPAPNADDVRDAERYRWLVADHDNKDTRQKCRDLLSRLGVMSYSAASSEIDQAIAQEVK